MILMMSVVRVVPIVAVLIPAVKIIKRLLSKN